MKYVIIIPDGAADHPLDELEGQTPFEQAAKPHTDRLSIEGRQGTVATTPEGKPCGSDVCSMSLLGYDPQKYHSGRAPLEAAALGIPLTATDWIFRVNLVTVIDGAMADHSAGAISSNEGAQLLADLAAHLDLPGMTLYPGVSYRNILVDSSGQRDWEELLTIPPHDVPGEPITRHLPVGGPYAELLCDMIQLSERVFADHDINHTRQEMGETPATHVWPWGQGTTPSMPLFQQRFGFRGAMITAVDLLAGIARFIGWDRLEVPDQSSYHVEQDYAAAGRRAVDAIDEYDIVCVHIETPDEASHQADAPTKVAAIESIDRDVVGPILERLEAGHEPWRVLYLPDHYTHVTSRKHDPTPVPFAMCGHRVRGVLERPLTEQNAAAADLHIDFGHELMEFFLRSAL